MLIRFGIKIVCFLLSIKFAFADIIDVNNEQIKELSKINFFSISAFSGPSPTITRFA